VKILSGDLAAEEIERLASRGGKATSIEPQVSRIVADVRRHGDVAVRRYAQRWEGLERKDSLRIPAVQLHAAWRTLAPKLRKSLREAATRIRQFCEWQKPSSWTRTHDGISLGQLILPLESVGCYIPSGRHPLVSTLLMTVIPAQVAGVGNIRVVSPKPSPEVLAAASMLGVNEFYRVGGAQAIAALAYGTKTIPRVDKIVGPGNAYVTAAKRLVAFDCAIDFLAGPTEALILSTSGHPQFIASDLVAQAEHDPDALAIFITTSRRLAQSVVNCVDHAAQGNSTALQSLRRHGVILVASSRPIAREWANALAPEHITVSKEDLSFIQNAGSIFVGDYSAQAAGDYATGPNHVLPTSGQARFRGGLSVLDFVKVVTVQELSRSGLRRIAPTIESLAEIEGLQAHAESIRLRCNHA
jgi:histidinol dehydrogenase